MKCLDEVRVIRDKKEYNDAGVFVGRIGRIVCPEIRGNTFEVVFIDSRYYNKEVEYDEETLKNMEDDIYLEVDVADLEFVSDSLMKDEDILNVLPDNDPRWWCKVENGFIYNLLGEKKNKIAYDYDS